MTNQNDPRDTGISSDLNAGHATGAGAEGPRRGRSGGSLWTLIGAAVVATLVVVAFLTGVFEQESPTGATRSDSSPPAASSAAPGTNANSPQRQPASPGTSGPQAAPAPAR